MDINGSTETNVDRLEMLKVNDGIDISKFKKTYKIRKQGKNMKQQKNTKHQRESIKSRDKEAIMLRIKEVMNTNETALCENEEKIVLCCEHASHNNYLENDNSSKISDAPQIY